MRSGSNEEPVGVGLGVPPTEPRAGAGEDVGGDAGEGLGDPARGDGAVPQAARAAAVAITRAVCWIRIEWFLSFSECAGGTTTSSFELRE
jgi:hypothetical protein